MSQIRADEISRVLREEIDNYERVVNVAETGSVISLGDYSQIKEGDEVRRTGRIMSIPVGEGMIGRVVDALGLPIDGKGPIEAKAYNHIERIAPGVVDR